MKAVIDYETVTVKLTLSKHELEQIVIGLGRTSPRSRESSGMNEEQAGLVGQLYFAMSEALEGEA